MIETPIGLPKLRKLMKKIEGERGPFVLFGLFKREDSPGKWDLVLAAPWLERGRLKALDEFVKEMSETFGEEEVLLLSRIVTLNHDDPALHAILNSIGSVTRPIEKQGHSLFGLPVEQAYVLRARRPSRAPAAVASTTGFAAGSLRQR